jgi:GNAT superfamily N-acetyltransferase
MTSQNPTTPFGYSDVAPGHVASVVTCLEMLEKPALTPAPLPAGVTLERVHRPGLDAYRALFRLVGSDWLWTSRIFMSDEELGAVLGDEAVEVYVVRREGRDIGLMELDFREPGQCELAFLGLDSANTGKGLGRALINRAIDEAWSRPIRRLWVHTCTFDHPSALGFYVRWGFTPYAFMVEMLPDPRLTGQLPPQAAPHVPLIRVARSQVPIATGPVA